MESPALGQTVEGGSIQLRQLKEKLRARQRHFSSVFEDFKIFH